MVEQVRNAMRRLQHFDTENHAAHLRRGRERKQHAQLRRRQQCELLVDIHKLIYVAILGQVRPVDEALGEKVQIPQHIRVKR